MDKLRTYNHGKGKIVVESKISLGQSLTEGLPTELHLKEDGSLDDKPSFAIVIEDASGNRIIGQISHRMLSRAFNELGYDLIALPK